MIKIMILLVAFLSLASCVRVLDTRAYVDDNFATQADVVALKTSGFKASDQRFNQSFLGYTVTGTKHFFVTRESERLIDSRQSKIKVESDVIDWLLFGSPYPYNYEYATRENTYELQSQAQFSFKVNEKNFTDVKVHCGHFYVDQSSVSKQEDNNVFGQSIHSNEEVFAQRQDTFLSCEYRNSAEAWHLSFHAPFKGAIRTEFTEKPEHWRIAPILKFYQILANQEERTYQDFPPWVDDIAGFNVFYQGRQVGAISTIGKPRLWLLKDAPQVQRQQTAALLYTLFMFTDFDREWD